MATGAAVAKLPQQLTLDAGGATVDTSTIGSIRWGAETRDLPGEFKKGADVEVTLTARVLEVQLADKYDAHGNVTETVRKHVLRVDEQSARIVQPRAYQTAAEAEPPAEE